jgi:glutathione S-transferase
MKLFMNSTSPYTRVALIALWEKGWHDIETRIVDPWRDPPEPLAADPSARVPALITDDGQALSETLLIMLWKRCGRSQPCSMVTRPPRWRGRGWRWG